MTHQERAFLTDSQTGQSFPITVHHSDASLPAMNLRDAAEHYRGWIGARLTTDAERELAALKLAACERILDRNVRRKGSKPSEQEGA